MTIIQNKSIISGLYRVIYGTALSSDWPISSSKTIAHSKFRGPGGSHRQNHIVLVVVLRDVDHSVSKIRLTRRRHIDPNGTHIVLVVHAQGCHTHCCIDKVCHRLSCIICREIKSLYASVVQSCNIGCSSPVVEQSCRLLCAQIIYTVNVNSLWSACIEQFSREGDILPLLLGAETSHSAYQVQLQVILACRCHCSQHSWVKKAILIERMLEIPFLVTITCPVRRSCHAVVEWIQHCCIHVAVKDSELAPTGHALKDLCSQSIARVDFFVAGTAKNCFIIDNQFSIENERHGQVEISAQGN